MVEDLLDYRYYPRMIGIGHNHHRCLKYISSKEKPLQDKEYGICQQFLSKYLLARTNRTSFKSAEPGKLCSIILKTVSLILQDEAMTDNVNLTFQYTEALWNDATEFVEPRLVFDYSKKSCCGAIADESQNSHMLVAAVYLGLDSMVTPLLQTATASSQSCYFGSPLRAAVSQGHTSLVRTLLNMEWT